MRSRAILLVVAILLVAGFAALNWSEIIRPSPLLFGPIVMDAPMGLILLALLALATIAFALTAGAIRTQALLESREHHKTLEAQRALADKAEASRFTDLRQHLDLQLRELRDRDTIGATEFQKSVLDGHRELRAQLEQTNRTLSARMSEMEHRLENRFERVPGYGPASSTPTTMPAQHVQATATRHEAAQDAELRELQARQDRARLEQERIVPERVQDERGTAVDRPTETGWRRWF
ncbi:MAG: hypothetical protein EOO24_37175 [Comamonadaceae bacterium]|nr:MAG: hypothetical protein EOO24_37175 [Comamonadaceae bacterium]